MPISFAIHEEQGLFVSRWVGAISDSDLIPSYDRLFANEKYQPGFHELVDLRNANMAGVTVDGSRGLARMVESYLAGKCGSFRTAVIAPEDLSFGIARIYGAVAEESPEDVMVFRELTDALEWIGVDD